MSINGRYQTIMSLRLPEYLREELSRTADQMEMSDSNLVRIAIQSAITKYANQNLTETGGW